MLKLLRTISMVVCTLLIALNGFSQGTPEMADTMRSNGKIYVVVAICLIILVGLFIYVMMLDRKITRIEKNKDA